METKHFLLSKSIWYGIGGLISSIILFFTSQSVHDKYFALTTAVMAIGAIYGRLTAKHKLVVRKKDAKKSS